MASSNPKPIPEVAKDLLQYDSSTGIVTWKKASGTRSAGAIAGTVNKFGHIRIQVAGVLCLAHRVAWFLHYGRQPTLLDHRDNNPANNRIDNLREATQSQNTQNAITRVGRSGVRNVMWKNNAWEVRGTFGGKRVYGGRYQDIFQASDSAAAMRNAYYGEFANHCAKE